MGNNNNNIYKEDSIRSADPREFTRMRPELYCGSTEYSTQLLKEIFTNAVDEHRIGNGDLIEIYISTRDNMFVVTDHGQGFFVNTKMQDSDKTILEASYSVLNTSGKYDEDGAYSGISNGTYGIGGKLTNFLSKIFNVSSTREGIATAEALQFKDGFFVKRELLNVRKEAHGTSIQYIPDEQFFTNCSVDLVYLKKYFKEITALCPKLTIELTVDDKKEVFHSKNGIFDLIDTKVKGKEIIKSRFMYKENRSPLSLDLILTYTSDYSGDITSYVNCGLVEEGAHLTALKSALTRTFNKYASENNLLKKGETNLTGTELNEGLVIIFNMDAPNVKYDGQTKTKVIDVDKTLLNEAINKDFYSWLCNNSKDAKVIIEKALQARKAKNAARKAREAVRKPVKKRGLKAKMEISEKLADCNSKNRKDCEILIVEGDSAAGSAKNARQPETQAIMALRGKVLNVEKTTIDKMMSNKEISTMIAAFGAGFKEAFDINQCRYGKIILLTDSDVDGSHIDILLLTFLYKYMRELIEKGYVYIAVPPLYRAIKGNKYTYLKDEKELEEYNKTNKNYSLQRFKGLGEMSPDQLWESTMNPETRTLKQITIEDAENASRVIENLMGSDVLPRKDFIALNGDKVDLDI